MMQQDRFAELKKMLPNKATFNQLHNSPLLHAPSIPAPVTASPLVRSAHGNEGIGGATPFPIFFRYVFQESTLILAYMLPKHINPLLFSMDLLYFDVLLV